MKKIVSAVTALVLILGICIPSAVIAEDTAIQASELTDYVKGDKRENVFDASAQGGFAYLCSNNNATFTYDLDYGKSVKWYVRDGGFSVAEASHGFEGFELGDRNLPFDFEPEAGKTYAVYARVKNDSKNGVIPHFGAAMNDDYDTSSICYTNEYGAEGMALDGSGWQDFKATITLRNNYRHIKDIYKNVFFGLPVNGSYICPDETSFLVDASSSDSVYVAEEQPYDIEVTADKTVISKNGSVNFSARMLNQLEITGALSQEFEWYALSGDKENFVQGFNFSNNGKSSDVTVSCDESVKQGNYIIAAKSKVYGYVRLTNIVVKNGSLNDRTAPIPQNMIPDASADAGQTYLLQRNNTKISYDGYKTSDDSIGGYCVRYVYTGSGNFDINDENSTFRGFGGFEINSNTRTFGFNAESGKTYAIRANVKNGSQNGAVCRFGAAMNDGYSSKYIAVNEYGKAGMEVGEDWTSFNATITLPENYDTSNKCASIIYMGFADKSPEGSAFWLDCAAMDSVYLAEEKAVEIGIKAPDEYSIENGSDIDISASVLNQVGVKGRLSQELDWYCVSEDMSEAADGVTISENGDGIRIHVYNAERIKNGIRVAAVSEQYGLVSGITLGKKAEEKINIYVSCSGNDSDEGTREKPLATLGGARDRVRHIRSKGIAAPIDVIFFGGEYYFENTVGFGTKDSSQSRVTYKAADGENVIFSGAYDIDTSNAKKVTDSAVLSRLNENVCDKIIEIDLSSISDKLVQMTPAATIQQLCGNIEYPELYFDGEEQTLAQWPNGNAEYSQYQYISDDEIGYTEDNPSNWTSAENWWTGGYFNYDFRYTRLPGESVDSENKRIRLSADKSNSLYPYEGRDDLTHRWKAFNLLEELDVPTEWYIDTDSNKLYYYPPQNIKNGRMSLSVLKTPFVSVTGADNISFEGIEFTKTRGNAIEITNADSILINKCRFTDIGVDAFKTIGTNEAETDKNYWQRQKLDAAYNCEVSDCVFYNIGGHAAVIGGGNVDTLTPGNNVFKNNIVSKCSQKIKNYETILMNGCGNSIINNNISRTAFQAIWFYGNNHKISYNEIYNVRQETDDSGAIYCGRNTLQRGSVISYNYIHDLYSTNKMNFGHQPAIYWDDGQSGQKAEYNIIRDADIDVYTNGVDNSFVNNTVINTKKYANFNPYNVVAASNTNEEQDTFGSNIANEQLYYNTYENLKAIVESSSLSKNSLAKYNKIRENLYVNAGEDSRGIYAKIYASFSNANKSSFDGFVNPENQDYRVKSAQMPSNSNVLDESFDIDSIGIISANELSQAAPKLIAPFNHEGLNTDESIHFMWNDSFGATRYRITVAEDKEFKNVIADKTVYYNFADIAVPKKNDAVYYWKVTAENTSREFEAQAQSDVMSFTNSGKVTGSVAVNEDKTADIKVTNYEYPDGIDAVIFLAEYGENNELCRVRKFEKHIDYGKQADFSDTAVKIKDSEEIKRAELFVWDKNYKPLCGAYSEE